MRRLPSSTLFPYTTLFRSAVLVDGGHLQELPGGVARRARAHHAAVAVGVPLPEALRDDQVERAADHLAGSPAEDRFRSEEHTSELQSQSNLVCRLLLEKKK